MTHVGTAQWLSRTFSHLDCTFPHPHTLLAHTHPHTHALLISSPAALTDPSADTVSRFMTLLAICNTVVPTASEEGDMVYQVHEGGGRDGGQWPCDRIRRTSWSSVRGEMFRSTWRGTLKPQTPFFHPTHTPHS